MYKSSSSDIHGEFTQAKAKSYLLTSESSRTPWIYYPS